jgi:glycosyltransferase involved in cell wall biosynthesis
MKNILFYTDTPQLGGAENQMLLLAANLDPAKFRLSLACAANSSLDSWCKKFQDLGLEVLRISSENKHSPKHYFELRDMLVNKKIDLLHAHVWNPASCRYAYLAANRAKVPMIITEHDPFALNSIKKLYKKIALKKVARIVTISKANKRLLAELYPQYKDRLRMVHNGIDNVWWQSQLMGFRHDDKRRVKTEIFHANEDSLIVTCVAELHQRKGIDVLLKAIPSVTEKYPNLKFVFVGGGPDKKIFIDLAHKLKLDSHVVFLGQRSNIARLLASSDIFVLPSRREAFGLVNLESMLCGLPVIASRVGGIPEIIEDGKTGLLVAPENSQALSNAILKLVKSPKLRNDMGQAGQQRAITSFSAKTMAEKYQEIYEEI